MEVFDLAYARETLARAYALSEYLNAARKHRVKEARLGDLTQNPEDRKTFQNSYLGGDWHHLLSL